MRTKLILIASAAVVLALPALAQQSAPQQPGSPASAPGVLNNSADTSSPTALPEGGADETAVEEVSNANPAATLAPPSPPVEYPGWARRDPWNVGAVDSRNMGLSGAP